MANHFRSSEGQDGMAPVQQPETPMPIEPQVAPIDSADVTQPAPLSEAPAQPGAPAHPGPAACLGIEGSLP